MDKAHILREIKRTAAANGDTPPGWRRFLSETGIKKSDWEGVFWARWNDALREAGFAPNQLAKAYERTELLNKYAELAMELGRLPAPADLRLKTRSDPEFPNDRTFGRLGTKANIVGQLVEHFRGREGFENVVRWCEEYAPRVREVPGEFEVTIETEIGFVYLIKSGRFHKIGRTNHVGRRDYELGIQLPEPPTVVHVIRTDDPVGIEAYWHNRFAPKRKNGEWFELEPADVSAFKRRKFM